MTLNATFDADADTNSIVTQLTAPTFTANVWESAWVNATAYRRLTAIVAGNQPFATNGIVIEQSNTVSPTVDADAHYWTASGTGVNAGTSLDTHPINTAVTYYHAGLSVERIGLMARLVIKSGGTDPTTFSARLVGAGIT